MTDREKLYVDGWRAYGAFWRGREQSDSENIGVWQKDGVHICLNEKGIVVFRGHEGSDQHECLSDIGKWERSRLHFFPDLDRVLELLESA